MDAIELLPFQTKASDQIVARYNELIADDTRPWEKKHWPTPFYQALSALTGSGKTAILADTLVGLQASMPLQPVVLWISKAKAVVDQTLANFEAGGKYAHLLEGFMVMPLPALRGNIDIIKDGNAPVILLATVGSFNRGKGREALQVHQDDEDGVSGKLWDVLKDRSTDQQVRRPLIVVYDEGHNLSDQQTDLLLELEPDVILVASATMRTPGRLGKIIDRLRDHGWNDAKLVTAIKSKEVVDAGLVKRQIVIGGYVALMEAALDDLLSAMAATSQKSTELHAQFTPKAIYVCRTNISQEDGTRDSPARPFNERKAPPILIWRYLVEQKHIDPQKIAVYCDLKFDRKNNPPPEEFIHFSGGEEDFGAFSAGNFEHVIFNQSLQEGWDDPSCCFAYIDKSMASTIQVEQVIGRVLRQPGAKHYPDPDLNTANFYIRIDEKQQFPKILETVRRRIAAELPEVKIDGYSDRRTRDKMRLEPKQVLVVPEIHIDSEEAIHEDSKGRLVGPFADALNNIHDYRFDNTNTVGKGELVRAVQTIGDGSKASVETVEMQHSNRVLARWIVRRAVQSLYPRVSQSIDWMAPKFDARVEITSPAAAGLRDSAETIVDAYLEHSDLAYENENPYTVGPVLVRPDKVQKFIHSLHDGYSDLNNLELPFAEAIDAAGHPWVRNPSNGGYAIPLLQKGDTFNFYPDFLVWKDKIIFALDPKGDQLIGKDAFVKLLDIRDEHANKKVVVRLFTEGKWKDPQTKEASGGYTVWSMKLGKPHGRFYTSVDQAVGAALKP